MKPAFVTPDYTVFLAVVKGRIQAARLSAGRAVNRELVLLYWDIGRAIVEKQEAEGWGESVVERLAADLRAEFPDMRGFSTGNLWAMRRFFMGYGRDPILQQLAEELDLSRPAKAEDRQKVAAGPSSMGTAILQQLAGEIPWGHPMMLLDKVKLPAARL